MNPAPPVTRIVSATLASYCREMELVQEINFGPARCAPPTPAQYYNRSCWRRALRAGRPRSLQPANAKPSRSTATPESTKVDFARVAAVSTARRDELRLSY